MRISGWAIVGIFLIAIILGGCAGYGTYALIKHYEKPADKAAAATVRQEVSQERGLEQYSRAIESYME